MYSNAPFNTLVSSFTTHNLDSSFSFLDSHLTYGTLTPSDLEGSNILSYPDQDYQIIIQVLVSSTRKNILNKQLETDLESIIKNHNDLISEKYLDENAINSILIIFSHFAMKNIK